jgi:hypothetical protein
LGLAIAERGHILLEDVLQRRPIAVVIEIYFDQSTRFIGQSLQDFHEILFLECRRVPLFEDSQIDFLHENLELFLYLLFLMSDRVFFSLSAMAGLGIDRPSS